MQIAWQVPTLVKVCALVGLDLCVDAQPSALINCHTTLTLTTCKLIAHKLTLCAAQNRLVKKDMKDILVS